MISISGDNESVYSNKLLISVNSSHVPSKFSSADVNFDPDTLERIQKGEGHGSKDSHDVSTVRLDSYAHEPATTKSSFFLFRDSERRASNPPLSSLPPYSSPAPRKPSLPPKTRSTPRLPPKPPPGQKPRVNLKHNGHQVKSLMIDNLGRLLRTDISGVNVKARTHDDRIDRSQTSWACRTFTTFPHSAIVGDHRHLRQRRPRTLPPTSPRRPPRASPGHRAGASRWAAGS